MNEIKKISFVIPCYRSEQTISVVVREIETVIKSRNINDYEIILVNDYSPDQTWEMIKKISLSNTHIIGINLAKNFGQANATLAGLAHATGTLIVYADDDGQSPISELGKLLDRLDEKTDIIFANYPQKKNSCLQNAGSAINNLMAEILIKKPKNLHLSNFWICRRFIIDEVLKCQNPYPYIGGLFLATTNGVAKVMVEHRKRMSGQTTYSLRKMISLWLNGLTAFSVLPLRFATILGMLSSFLGFSWIFIIILQKTLHPDIPLGYSSIMSCLLFIGGILMLMLGIIGEYVGRIYLNINRIPQYVVKNIIRF